MLRIVLIGFGVGGLGAQADHAHSEREYILISSLPELTALLAGIVTEW
jgi:acetylornithine deacetylase/succinyl-diaminopimelate desuccinylase-like protein